MRRGVIPFAVTFLAFAGHLHAQSSPGAAPFPKSEPTILELGKPIEREMHGGEKHSYRVHAEAGQYIHVVLVQEGIHVAATLLDPAGKQILTADSMNGSYGPETASTIAETSGDLRLDVTAGSSDVPVGHYQIQLKDLRAPIEADRTRIKAEQAYMEGSSLYSRGGAESVRAAAAKWQESFAVWQSLDDKYGQALSLRSMGQAYSALSENQKALNYYNQALPLERAAADRAGEATALINAGIIYAQTGDREKALINFNLGLTLERELGDRTGEANTLRNIGVAYYSIGNLQKALDYFIQILPVDQALGNRAGEARTLSNIGTVYSTFGENQKAADYYNRALALATAVGDHRTEASAQNGLGLIYSSLGEQKEALDHFEQALPLIRGEGDRAGEAGVLANMAGIYSEIGEKQKALEYNNQALSLERAVGDRSGEAGTLNNIGLIYSVIGEQQKALDYYNQALPIEQATKDRYDEARTLRNIGGAYSNLGEKQKALDYYNQSLPIERAVGDRVGEADVLRYIGAVYLALGENQKALDYFNQALTIELAVEQHFGEAYTLRSIGETYLALGDNRKALNFYTQSLPLFRAVQDPLGEGRAMVLLMDYWKRLKNPTLAILFGKEAIDRFQQVRRNIQGLGKETQQSFVKSKEDYYRELADLLISQGRLSEAEQVLDLLKAEEYSDFTQRRGNAGSDTKPVALTPTEEKKDAEYEATTSEITAIGAEWTQLHAKSSRTPEEDKRYSEVSAQLTAANQRLQIFLNSLYESFGKGYQANERVEAVNEETGRLQNDLGTRTVALYTLVLDDKCVVMVITPATRVAREIPITKIALRGKVFAFARALADRASAEDIQVKALDLYNILIAPIEKDLQGARAKTLVWSLDDVLRYVPLAALYDGKQYLVERYQNVVITTASAGNLKDKPEVSRWRGAAMGVSKDYDGLGQLKAVPGELDSVIRSASAPGSHGPIPGTILLDDSFTETSMETALEQHPALVHVASHYVFEPGDDKKSYLLLGGKETGGHGFHLTLADMRDDQRMDFRGVELLTLSGCQTALGSNDSDGREIDGLGITAQRKGAKAVVATLWPVEDVSVGLLMETFYKLWITTPGMTKAAALQKAQLALMRGTPVPMGPTGASSHTKSPLNASAQKAPSQYANPFYWAPFILIGNWK